MDRAGCFSYSALFYLVHCVGEAQDVTKSSGRLSAELGNISGRN